MFVLSTTNSSTSAEQLEHELRQFSIQSFLCLKGKSKQMQLYFFRELIFLSKREKYVQKKNTTMKWSSTEIVILTLKTLLVNIAFYLYKYSSQTSILKIRLLWVMWSLQSNASALARVIVKKMQRNLGITHLETLVITSLHPEAISYYTFSHNDEDLEKQKERKKSNKTVQVDLAFIICFLLFSFQCLGLLLHYAVCSSPSHLSKFSFSIICILALASRMLPIAISALKKTSTHIQ